MKQDVVEVDDVAGSVKRVEPGVGDGERAEVVPFEGEAEVVFDLVEGVSNSLETSDVFRKVTEEVVQKKLQEGFRSE
jgi:hypothetical protein